MIRWGVVGPGTIAAGFFGFACPVDARNGTHSTVLPRSLNLGTHLITGAQATRVSDNGDVEIAADGASRVIRAGRIVLAGGAIETARLLQLSGLGNDWVGDCLQGHTYVVAFGCSTPTSTMASAPVPPPPPAFSPTATTAS
ncbi:GMC family oxidoreductase N-terminal domain-containing protein [Streptomyces sviceus]|uniref:GMC family oxidoreductase N-terminal domain-containing protein n=1 Tax=Streptomyces sviceus TaxID=285530 RepID=UPI003676DF3A